MSNMRLVREHTLALERSSLAAGLIDYRRDPALRAQNLAR